MLNRRGVLKFIGGAVVGTLATPVVWKGLDDLSIWSQNWGWVPRLDYGNQKFTTVRTVSKMCPSATGMQVRLVGGRPIRTVGDPKNPLSRGGISPLAVTEVQLRYSPARVKRPLLRGPDGGYKVISWEEAERILQNRFRVAKGAGGNRLVCISGDENGSINEVFSGIATQMGQSQCFVMPGNAQTTAVAWKEMEGTGRAGFDFEHSDYVLSVGANVLETWGTVMSNRRAWGNAHPIDADATMRLDYAGPVQNNTAVGADTWLPINPGSEVVLLLAIARKLIADGVAVQRKGLDVFKAVAEIWTPEKCQQFTGLTPAKLDTLVENLKKAKAPLVIAGSEGDKGGGSQAVKAAMGINLLLDRLNKKGGLRAIPTLPPVVKGAVEYGDFMSADLVKYAMAVTRHEQPKVKLLVVYEANPFYALPGHLMEPVMANSDFSIAFTAFMNETARHCNLVLPSAMGLERYDDVAQPFGFGQFIYTLARPAAKPLYESRPAGEVLFDVAKKVGFDLGVHTMEELLKAKAAAAGADWKALAQGESFVSDAVLEEAPHYGMNEKDGARLYQIAVVNPETDSKQLRVAFTSRLALGTSESAIPPFNTKNIADNELFGNILVAGMNAATLRKFALTDGRVVVLTNPAGAKITVQVHTYEGVVNDTVVLTMGFGHQAFDAFNNGKGMNALDLAVPTAEPGDTGPAIWNGTRITIAKA